MPSIYEEEEGS